MKAVITSTSALYYWRTHSRLLSAAPASPERSPSRRRNMHIEAPSARLVSELRAWGLVDPASETNLLVSSRGARRSLKNARASLCLGPFPANSFELVFDDVWVASPELMFLLLARELTLVELVEIGCELCGTYRLTEDGSAFGLAPLTSVQKLRAYAARASGMHGRKKALRALQWVVDDAASPAETALAIALGMPYRHGGFGLGGFVLNRELALDRCASHMFGRDTIRPDFFWTGSRHPLEYDSSTYHSSREQAELDERRRNAYAAMGMCVTVVRPRHLRNTGLLDEVARSVRSNSGRKWGRLPADFEYRKDALHEHLFRFWRSAQCPVDSQMPAP